MSDQERDRFWKSGEEAEDADVEAQVKSTRSAAAADDDEGDDVEAHVRSSKSWACLEGCSGGRGARALVVTASRTGARGRGGARVRPRAAPRRVLRGRGRGGPRPTPRRALPGPRGRA